MNGYIWDDDVFAHMAGFRCEDAEITLEFAERIFQLDPPPPVVYKKESEWDNYIFEAQKTKELKYLLYYLHCAERFLNHYIRGLWGSCGSITIAPDELIGLKTDLFLEMSIRLPDFNPNITPEKKIGFLGYLRPYARDIVREHQKGMEQYSFSSLSVYKKVRKAIWSRFNQQDPVTSFMESEKCSLETAERYVKDSLMIHSREDLDKTDDEGVRLDEAIAGRPWNPVVTMLQREKRRKVQAAFQTLTEQERYYLEYKNAICMHCGRVSDITSELTFDNMGAAFEFATANGAEKAYHKALEKLAHALVESKTIRTVSIHLKSRTGKAHMQKVIYEYQPDFRGGWGKIEFDFGARKARVLQRAEYDLDFNNCYVRKSVSIINAHGRNNLPKTKWVGFDYDLGRDAPAGCIYLLFSRHPQTFLFLAPESLGITAFERADFQKLSTAIQKGLRQCRCNCSSAEDPLCGLCKNQRHIPIPRQYSKIRKN